MLILLLLATMVAAEKSVQVKYGELIINGFRHCNITHNINDVEEVHVPAGGMALPGLYYGLIEWACDWTDVGILISRIECIPCGVYCSFNQSFNKCTDAKMPLLIGSIIGLMFFLMTTLALLLFCRKHLFNVFVSIVVRALTMSDRRRAKKIKSHNKRTGSSYRVMFKDINVPCDKIMEGIKKG